MLKSLTGSGLIFTRSSKNSAPRFTPSLQLSTKRSMYMTRPKQSLVLHLHHHNSRHHSPATTNNTKQRMAPTVQPADPSRRGTGSISQEPTKATSIHKIRKTLLHRSNNSRHKAAGSIANDNKGQMDFKWLILG